MTPSKYSPGKAGTVNRSLVPWTIPATAASGMFAEVEWLQRRPRPSLFVPPTSVVSTTERSFVIRIVNGVVEWVDVKRGVPMGGLVEVFGDLKPGDLVAVRATDELRAGTPVTPKSQ